MNDSTVLNNKDNQKESFGDYMKRLIAESNSDHQDSEADKPTVPGDHGYGVSHLVAKRRKGADSGAQTEKKPAEVKLPTITGIEQGKATSTPAGFVEFNENGIATPRSESGLPPTHDATEGHGAMTNEGGDADKIVKQPEQPEQPEASTEGPIGEWETLVENAINQPKADPKLLSDIHQALNLLTAPQDKPFVTEAIVKPIFSDEKHINLLNISLPDKNSPRVSRFSEDDISLLRDLDARILEKISAGGGQETTVKVPIIDQLHKETDSNMARAENAMKTEPVKASNAFYDQKKHSDSPLDESPPSEAIQGIVAEDTRDNAEEPKLPTKSDERTASDKSKITIDTVEPKLIYSDENIAKSMPVTPKTEQESTEAKNPIDPFDREVEEQHKKDLAKSGFSAVEVADTVKTANTVEQIKQPKRGGLLDPIRRIGQIRRIPDNDLSAVKLANVRPGKGGDDQNEEKQMAEVA